MAEVFGEISWTSARLSFECTEWIIGKGGKIHFWFDTWCISEAFNDRFPQIYALSKFKIALVEEVVPSDSPNTWNITVSRNLQDWEIEEYETLLLCLSHVQIKNHGDKLRWKHKKNDNFTVSSFYDFLDSRIYRTHRQFPAKIIWKSGAPPRIPFFT